MDWVSSHHPQHSLTPQEPFFVSSSHFPPLPIPPPPSPPLSGGSGGGNFNLDNKISPSVLLIIIILAIIFFISGLLHLLVRFLFRPTSRDPEDLDNVTALQGQLQQLFHLHDSGVDQSYIDTLPVFHYKAIIGLKNPFDCAVCLCEFEADDKLRLLPKCSHAFHLECIDTWLLSHSTCPLCRGSLLPSEFTSNNNYSPIVLVLESGSESSREIVSDRDGGNGANSFVAPNGHLGCHVGDELGSSCNDISLKFNENPIKDEPVSIAISSGLEEKVVPVKLGKFRNVDGLDAGEGGRGEGSSSTNSNVDARRCFSMGSFEYVMDETSTLQVAIKPQVRKQPSKKPTLPLTPGHRTAMSECDCNSNRFKGFDGFRSNGIHSGGSNISPGNGIGRSKKDSFSISKIWLRTKKEKPASTDESSRRAFSFRFPLQQSENINEFKVKDGGITSKRSSISDMDVSRWENSELGVDEEVGSCISMDSQPNMNTNMPPFARKTLQWLKGRQNKVVHSSTSPNV